MNWIVLILISAFFIAIRTILLKELLTKNSTTGVLFLTAFIATISMIFFKNEITLNLSLSLYLLILLKSIFIAATRFLLYKSYKKLEISVVTPLTNLSPVFLIILSLIFLHESISLINYIGIFILMITAYTLELKSLRHFLEPLKLIHNKYFIYIIIALLTISASAVLDKIILDYTNYHTVMFLSYLFMSIIFLGTLIYKKRGKELNKFISLPNLALLFFITLTGVLSDLSYFAAVALPTTLIVLIIPLKRLSTFVTTLIGGKIFHEKHLAHKGGVCLIMVLGILLVTI